MWIEEIAGERFTSVEPTPLLAECIASARAALESGLGERAEVAVSAGWEFEPQTRLVPSIVVVRDHAGNGRAPIPDLVVELRTESTGRYILGPKRMVYSRFRVPEFWYVDPRHRRMAILRSNDGGEYDWPPLLATDGDSVTLTRFPDVSISVRDLLGPTFTASDLVMQDADAWLAS